MDVTHIPEFGHSPYVHITTDTFSHFILATARAGEEAKHCIAHLLYCFSILGVPQQLKTDNAPTYCSKAFSHFYHQYRIQLKHDIAYNPQGQGIVERAHQTLKNQIFKVKTLILPRQPQISSLSFEIIFHP